MPNTSKEYMELEKFFKSTQLPATMQLGTGVFIPDVKKFVDGNLLLLGTGEMNEMAAAGRYYRMEQLKKLLS